MRYDVVIANGLYFDGTGSPGRVANIGVRGGRVAAVESAPLVGARTIDAAGCWVMPGFLDTHTHYDAEVIGAPGLEESVRHGVTTVFVGSCSLGTVFSDALDCADMFSRVEALPREPVLALLEREKTWTTPEDYIAALEARPLGPNVAAFVGHSDLRVSVLGLDRSVSGSERPTAAEHAEMASRLEAALDAGFLGMSSMTNPWDKLDGDRHRSAWLPSAYGSWGEYRRLHKVLRRRGRVLQSAPNITTKVNALLFVLESAGFGVRKPLKTTLITAADAKSSPGLALAVTGLVGAANTVAGADMRWQTVPMEFEVYADGIDLVVFEEFGAGEAALHLKDQIARNALMRDEAYRRRFRRDYAKRFSPRVWQRDFYDTEIVECPDATVIGRSFGAVADARGIHPVDAFLDLVVEHGTAVRWRTTIANHRRDVLERLVAHPTVQISFSDSGAHLRNMAFYNFALAFLRLVHDAAERGAPIMPLETAVRRVTGELAEWFDVDAGHLRVGDRADLVVVDPAGLDGSLDGYHEAPLELLGGVSRMVRRNDGAVRATLIGGECVFEDGAFADGFGTRRRHGRFLRAGAASSAVDSADGATGEVAAAAE
ncbi:MAG: amidohydrolase family protein [Myxococcales bacterium]|nr:amidohydrolase family protein [Myxococcales bacterium]MCB9519635.1 amidohydrolase family protein [Myxococcales bacterium]MCB9530634.1 amidohydrolase family protein [Myxococcales bacterium]